MLIERIEFSNEDEAMYCLVSSFQTPEDIISTSFVFVDGLCDNYDEDGVVDGGVEEEEDETKGDEDDFENQPYFSTDDPLNLKSGYIIE